MLSELKLEKDMSVVASSSGPSPWDTKIILFAIGTGQVPIYECMLKEWPKLGENEEVKQKLQEARSKRKKAEHKKKKELYKEVDEDGMSEQEKEKLNKQNLCLALQKMDAEMACRIMEKHPWMSKDEEVLRYDTGPLSSFMDHFKRVADEKTFLSILEMEKVDEEDMIKLERILLENKEFIFMNMYGKKIKNDHVAGFLQEKKELAETELKAKTRLDLADAVEELKKAIQSNNKDAVIMMLNAFPSLALRDELFQHAPNKFRLLADEKRKEEKRKKMVQMVVDGRSLEELVEEMKQTPELYFDDQLIIFMGTKFSEEELKPFHAEMRRHAYKQALIKAMKEGDKSREIECVTEYEDLVEDEDVIQAELDDYDKDAVVKRDRANYYTEQALEGLEKNNEDLVRISLQRFPDIALTVATTKDVNKTNRVWLDTCFCKYGCTRLGPVGEGVDDIPMSEKQIIGRCIEAKYVISLAFFQTRWASLFGEGKPCEDIGKQIASALKPEKKKK